jgi:hypothetical protein
LVFFSASFVITSSGCTDSFASWSLSSSSSSTTAINVVIVVIIPSRRGGLFFVGRGNSRSFHRAERE